MQIDFLAFMTGKSRQVILPREDDIILMFFYCFISYE